MEIKKSLNYKTEDEKYVYILTPKDMQNVNVDDQESLINKFFETFDITISSKSIPTVKVPVPTPTIIPRPARKKHESMIEIWNNAKQYLEDEFTAEEYWEALKKAGYDYKPTTRQAIPFQHLKRLINMRKIERTAERPAKWKKIYLKTSDEGIEDVIKSLKEGKKVELGVIK